MLINGDRYHRALHPILAVTFCVLCMPKAFCEIETVRKKVLLSLWILWEKKLGYTDASGNDNINVPLSQRRAEAVSSYLKGRGVSSRQIRSVQGFGSANPIENKTISQANRRVEVYLYASSEMVRQANNGSL